MQKHDSCHPVQGNISLQYVGIQNDELVETDFAVPKASKHIQEKKRIGFIIPDRL
ncbi:hypothetical protein [Oribacterium sp. FC2011]|uniref:hypothetical protein n=1 Tax=Oribacterium sp. FC2011 TaxID=1408311 RepID=UPI0012DF303E|nr:hypothetical protein [Oribacterium sp. FC2011]